MNRAPSFLTTPKPMLLAVWVLCFLQSTLFSADKPPLKDFIGINGHTVQFRPALYSPAMKLVRDYHPIHWDLGDETNVSNEWPQAKNKVDWNHIYSSWQKEGFTTNVCLIESHLEPKKWNNLAKDAERYGREFAESLGSRGRNLVTSAEIGNEPGEYSDDEYRTLFQSMAKGLRAGDPKMLIATCNLTPEPKSGKYDKSVDVLKGFDHLYDVLTIHLYAQIEPWPTWKRSYPEDRKADYLPILEKLIQWRDKNAPKKQIWITEFGWDCSTKKPTKQDEFIKWQGNTDLQQAQWLIRSILCFSKYSVDRAYIYFFDDNDEPKLHASAGITRKFKPKMSYHALVQMQNLLGEYRFSKVIQEKEAWIYEYVHAKEPSRKTWAIWSPTGDGRSVATKVNLPAKVKWTLTPLATDTTAAQPTAGTGPTKIDAQESVQYLQFTQLGD